MSIINKPFKRTERGWAGHYICADRCRFRRNTLLEYSDQVIVVSTVGNLFVDGKLETIGSERYAETFAFEGRQEGLYIEADTSKPINIESEHTSMIVDNDNKLDEMHENVVNEMIDKLREHKND